MTREEVRKELKSLKDSLNAVLNELIGEGIKKYFGTDNSLILHKEPLILDPFDVLVRSKGYVTKNDFLNHWQKRLSEILEYRFPTLGDEDAAALIQLRNRIGADIHSLILNILRLQTFSNRLKNRYGVEDLEEKLKLPLKSAVCDDSFYKRSSGIIYEFYRAQTMIIRSAADNGICLGSFPYHNSCSRRPKGRDLFCWQHMHYNRSYIEFAKLENI